MKKLIIQSIVEYDENNNINSIEFINNDNDNIIEQLNNHLKLSFSVIKKCSIDMKCINNEELTSIYEDKINNLISKLDNQTMDKEQKIEELTKYYNNEINSIRTRTQQETLRSLQFDIDIKNRENETMKTMITNLQTQIDTIYKNQNELIKNKETDLTMRYDNKIEDLNVKICELKEQNNIVKIETEQRYTPIVSNLTTQIDELKDNLIEYKIINQTLGTLDENIKSLSNRKSNFELGDEGEDYVCQILHQHYSHNPNVRFQRCQNETGAGDIKLKLKINNNLFNGCIDPKNKKSANQINKTEIEKLKKDVDNVKNDYSFGVLISIEENTFYNDIQNFDIIYTKNNKPIICIKNVLIYPDFIPIAIKLISQYLIETNNKDTNAELDKFKLLINSQVKSVNSNISSVKTIQSTLKTLTNSLNQQLKDLATNKQQTLNDKWCSICEKEFNSIKTFTNHMKKKHPDIEEI